MRSNRIIILLVSAALLEAGCTKNTVDLSSERSISFAPVSSKPTRAIIQGSTYPEGESFRVSAFYNGTDAYFTDLSASRQPSINLWETSTPEYWPLGGSLTFHAFSPASASGVTISSDGVSAAGYTIQSSGQMTTDLLYGNYTVSDCAAHPEAVPLDFSHALSQVVFRVKAAEYYPDASISMTSLSMGGINSIGDFSSAGWEHQNTEYSYALSTSPSPLTYDSSYKPETVEVCSFLFIPQELGPNAAVTVGYSITQRVSGDDYVFSNSPVPVHLGGTITQWESGRKYIYTLNIGLNNLITISASAVGWSDQSYEIIVKES